MAEDDDMPTLQSYLSYIRRTVFPATKSPASNSASVHHNDTNKMTLVLGNPSADLDSFISAVVTSYFYNRRPPRSTTNDTPRRTYVPILNLPAVKSTELWRLRPEFGVALRLALGESLGDVSGGGGEQGKVAELEELVTIADVREDERSELHGLFTDTTGTSDNGWRKEKQDLFLVDHNSPSIAGLSEESIRSRFNVVGCVDHHVDENYISKDAKPRIVTTGIGSCTSLVVKHLRDEGLWPSETSGNSEGLEQIVKLALAPILIDTSNLKATGDKCSDTDREAVRFLESQITNRVAAQDSYSIWDRDPFHKAISTTKASSLDLLTVRETFERDYKVWTELTKHGKEINIGVSSLVKPLSWLVEHAGGRDQFVNEIEKFATAKENRLGVFAMLTRAGPGKEVVIIAFDKDLQQLTEDFGGRSEELRLKEWEEDDKLLTDLGKRFVKTTKIWWMGDTSKSRKQVGPLLRDAVKNV